MVHSSITDHILKRSSIWLALAMPLKFGIVEKLLVRRTRESFPFRKRRCHIWTTSSSQSASADWLSDSNGRSLWPISAAYGAAATTVSTVSTVILRFFFFFATNGGRFLGWSVFQAHMQLCNDEEKEWICKLLVSTRSSNVGQFFFLFYLLSFASLAFSMPGKSSSHSSSSSSSESVAPTGLTITCSTWRKRKNLKKRLSEARVAKKSKSSDTVTAGSGSVAVDEEFEHACRWRKPKKLWKTVMA